MKFVRTSMYPQDASSPNGVGQPGSVIVNEDDLKVSPDQALADLREKMPGIYFAQEIWEMPDDTSVAEATAEGMRRQMENEREVDQAVLYYWTIQQLPRVSDAGMLSTTDPSPLSRAEISDVLELVVLHPNYKRQLIRVHDEDERTVVVKTQEPFGVVFEDQG